MSASARSRSSVGQIEAGEHRLLATYTDERLETFPDVPTAREQGIDLVVEKFRGLAGPKGLPAGRDRRLGGGDPEAAGGSRLQGVLPGQAACVPAFMPHDEYAKFIEQVRRASRRRSWPSTASPRTEARSRPAAACPGTRSSRLGLIGPRRAVLARRRPDPGEQARGHRRRPGGAQGAWRSASRCSRSLLIAQGAACGARRAPPDRRAEERRPAGRARHLRAAGMLPDRHRLPRRGRHDRLHAGGRPAGGGGRALSRRRRPSARLVLVAVGLAPFSTT